MSSLSRTFTDRKNGCVPKAKLRANGIQETLNTLETLNGTILSFGVFGVKFQAIDVFWCPLEHRYFNHGRNEDSISDNDDSSRDTDGSDELVAARPPDGLILPIWRTCHMGIILEAYCDSTSKEQAQLIIAVELFEDGIHMKHSFGESWKTKKEVVQELRSRSAGDFPVFSAGVKREIHVDLDVLSHVVDSFKNSKYDVITFNCQHFTSIVFHRFTGQILRDLLRRRWTSNHNSWGFRCKTDQQSTIDAMSWARTSRTLMEQLQPVQEEPFLFSRSPPGLDGTTRLALASVAFVGPVLGIALAAGSVLFDKIPQIRRLERSTIWFKYDTGKNDWFWTPYRDGEVPASQRWISVHTRQVQFGRFKGRELDSTCQCIIRTLAENSDLNPAENNEIKNCNICLDSKLQSSFLTGKYCDHSFCKDCFVQLDRCPFCRSSYQ